MRSTPAIKFAGTVTTQRYSTVCATFSGTAFAAHTIITFITIAHWKTINAIISFAFSTVLQIVNSLFSFTFVAEEFSTDIATEVLQAIEAISIESIMEAITFLTTYDIAQCALVIAGCLKAVKAFNKLVHLWNSLFSPNFW